MSDKGIADIQSLITNDVWECIKDNYSRGSYTTAITNLLQHINEVVQDKANLEHVDNTSLMEQAFSFNQNKNPKIYINKLQTRTEKDIQEGVLNLLKGGCLAIRNPRSHERYSDDKLTADRIILFYDYVLSFVREANEPKLVDDWLNFILDKDFVSTEIYAEETIKRIPEKKKYDILINLFRRNNEATPNKLHHIVNKLLSSLSTQEFEEFIRGIDKELIKCKNDKTLAMFFNLFPKAQWEQLDTLTKFRVENIVLKSIENANFDCDEDSWGNCYEYSVTEESMLAVYALDFFDVFSNRSEIINAINSKCYENEYLYDEYYNKYFKQYIGKENIAIQSTKTSILYENSDDLPF